MGEIFRWAAPWVITTTIPPCPAIFATACWARAETAPAIPGSPTEIDIAGFVLHTARVMQPTSTFTPRQEYFTACILAVALGLIRLVAKGEFGGIAVILVFLVLLIGLGVYFQFGRSRENGSMDPGMPGARRLYGMALLWYGLAVVLSAAFVRGPLTALGPGGGRTLMSAQGWLGMLGAAVAGFAVWRVIKIALKMKKLTKTKT